MAKLRVGLLFGGRSVEHEVSIASATSILGALDQSRYEVSLVAIDPEGRWHVGPPELPAETAATGEEATLPAVPGGATLVPVRGSGAGAAVSQLDVILPIVHGRGGEDGSLQGLFELAEVPYVGAGVLGSALQMDKETAKRLLHAASLPVVPWVAGRGLELAPERRGALADRAIEQLGLPLFVKPANSGSSVGIRRADEREAVVDAIGYARRFDTKIVIEQAVMAREIEVAVIGTDEPQASVPGEIRTAHSFYDYEAKYEDDATELVIPAPLAEPESERLRAVAVDAYRALEGRGLARVDFLYVRPDEFYVSELNSLPGFTRGSMFPLLWEATGLSYPQLLDRLIELAIEDHAVRSQLETVRPD